MRLARATKAKAENNSIRKEKDTTPSWDLGGNSGISSSNFLGTTDVRPLVMKTNGAEAMRLTPEGKVAIGGLGGPRSPDYALDVQGALNADEILKGGAPLRESRSSLTGL